MHLSNEHLAVFATERYGSRWLLHHASFETRIINWLRDQRDVTVAWELVKHPEMTRRVAADGVRLSLSGADASLCPVGKGLEAQTALAKIQPEAAAWLAGFG
jgi:hypothetical protein